MEDETIIKEVLFKLDNWVVKNVDEDDDLYENNSLECDDMKYFIFIK